MIYVLKTHSDYTNSYKTRMTLDGQEYGMLVRWNQRESAYYMSLYYQGDLLIGSVKMIQGYDLFEQFKSVENMPQGRMYLYDIQGGIGATTATPENLGQQIRLYYEEL